MTTTIKYRYGGSSSFVDDSFPRPAWVFFVRMPVLAIHAGNSLPALSLPDFESVRRIPAGVYDIAGRCIGPCGGPMWILRHGDDAWLLDHAFYEWLLEQQAQSPQPCPA